MEFRVSGIGYWVSSFGLRVLGVHLPGGTLGKGDKFRVSGSGYRVSGFGNRVPDFRFRVSGTSVAELEARASMRNPDVRSRSSTDSVSDISCLPGVGH